MKQAIKFLLGVIVMGVLFVGCKKDKDGTPNYFKVADTTYRLSWGEIYAYGTGAGWDDYGYQIFLYPGSMIYDESTDLWSGSGDFIKFELASDLSTGAASGTYTFHLFDVLPINSFDEFSYWDLNWNSADEQSEYLDSGTLTINNLTNDKYEISFTGTDYAGNVVKAHFKGELNYWIATKSTKEGAFPQSRGGFRVK
jgi:hypothetical protein